MAACTRIGNFVSVSHGRRDETERVTANALVGNRLFDPGHMTGDALGACVPAL